MPYQPSAGFPLHRPRRLRGHPRLRDLVRETILTTDDLIYPLFVYHGKNLGARFPRCRASTSSRWIGWARPSPKPSSWESRPIILFGIPDHKDARGSAALRDDGIVQQAIRLAKRLRPNSW